ncbi:MEKHLA domain-containing protein [Chlorogloeopsis sp. ULAP01]|uniref:MEKHLA domain-containing protein n=1 Tax=Chlorogloeopsis sp. ULAP01 TaxID=3056483 RepID=UPI0025AA916B|nr:MEKHLA domain-containing protein [Chlorogloeopsis sp. ULAP01]MDM9381334.1 MEKHLA domain-containing protein [Chlorogloeopsis sp. ULAP01]
MTSNILFPWQQEAVIYHSQRLLKSFHYWLGYSLLDVNGSPEKIAQALFQAPFVLASHDTQADPILNYGNCKALELWELSWEEFTRMPSRRTAQQMLQQERGRRLTDTVTRGYSKFPAIRITSTGKRFQIEEVILWNVLDEDERYCGQAAMFSNYKFMT